MFIVTWFCIKFIACPCSKQLMPLFWFKHFLTCFLRFLFSHFILAMICTWSDKLRISSSNYFTRIICKGFMFVCFLTHFVVVSIGIRVSLWFSVLSLQLTRKASGTKWNKMFRLRFFFCCSSSHLYLPRQFALMQTEINCTWTLCAHDLKLKKM